MVEDAATAQACASVLPQFDWIGSDDRDLTERCKGRSCVVVGQAGAAGAAALEALAKRVHTAGATPVKTVSPEAARPDGWGLHNALEAGWNKDRLLDWFRANRSPYPPPEPKRKNLAELWAGREERAEQRRRAKPQYPIWQEWGLQLGANGGPPLANLNNAVAIMEGDPALKGIVFYDEFLQRVMTEDPPREWSDADDIRLALYMQRDIGIAKIGREAVAQAVIAVAHSSPRNCVKDWLDALVHDGTPRIDRFFGDNFGAEESTYTAAASRNFWLSMVARVYRPGCKVDNMVVLEGSQGVGKSSALQIIGGEWFAEQHESATNPKGFAEILQGKLLIEISEMDSFNRAEVNRVKQTISCPSDRFRASYGRYALDHPRQCVFVGTTNRDDWNRDETGARRFWPIACRGPINLQAVRDNREQLFAEAVARHKAGEPHWLMPDEATRGEQEARYQADPWLGQVSEIIKGESKVTSSFVAEKLGISIERRDRTVEMRIGACLRFLGWLRSRRRVEGVPTRVYVRPGTEEA